MNTRNALGLVIAAAVAALALLWIGVGISSVDPGVFYVDVAAPGSGR